MVELTLYLHFQFSITTENGQEITVFSRSNIFQRKTLSETQKKKTKKKKKSKEKVIENHFVYRIPTETKQINVEPLCAQPSN